MREVKDMTLEELLALSSPNHEPHLPSLLIPHETEPAIDPHQRTVRFVQGLRVPPPEFDAKRAAERAERAIKRQNDARKQKKKKWHMSAITDLLTADVSPLWPCLIQIRYSRHRRKRNATKPSNQKHRHKHRSYQ